MFEHNIKKKSKITPGVLIIFGILLMSLVVIINNSTIIQTSIENIKTWKESKESV